MILKEHHIKYGLSTKEDDHCIILLNPFGGVIARYPITGIMSAQSIWDDADKWISKNLVAGGYRG